MPPQYSAERFSKPVQLAWLRRLAAVICCAMLHLFVTTPLLAAPDPPVQVYYLPVPEDQVLESMRTLYPGPAACPEAGNEPEVSEPIISYGSVSVVVAGTIVYYDHWEDGYEVNLSEPVQATTEIWGDGDLGNGAAPGVPGDVFTANTVVVLRSNVFLASRQTVIDYDGGDRIGATRSVALTRAVWGTGSGTRLAGALEIYPVTRWGTSFRAPVGTNTVSPDLFEYTAFAVMAAEDGTEVAIDLDGDGTAEIATTLNEGESYLTTGTAVEGASVNASAAVQVALITGDICADYESRWYMLFPQEQWDSEYYNPVSTDPVYATTAFLYNPHSAPLTVTREISGGVVSTLEVPAGGTISDTLPAGTGAVFRADDDRPFGAIAAVDTFTVTRDYDWGIDLVPARRLTAQTLIGWGAGRDPDSTVLPDENGNPVWVMGVLPEGANGPIEICVDYNGDNQGPNQDDNGFFYDEKLELQPLANARVYDPDGDQTGMLLYICGASVESGARLAAAWGQDPATATRDEPGLDVGTTAPPAAGFEAGKTADLIDDLDGDGLADAGDALRYTIVVRNAGRVALPNVVISDTLPISTTYLLSTTTVSTGTAPVALPDDVTGTPFPLDEGGVDLGPLPIGGVFSVTFGVRLDNPLPFEVEEIVNRATVTVGDESEEPEVVTPIDRDPGIDLLKTATRRVVTAGTVVTYTFTISNTGIEPLQAVTLTDNHCNAGFVGGDTNGDDILALDEIWTYTCSAVITQTTVNTATVTAQTAAGETVEDTDSWTVRLFSGNLYLPIIRKPLVPTPCPPPDGCELTDEIKGMAVHEGSNTLYVISRNPDRLLKVEPEKVTILAEAPTGSQPWGIVVDERANRVYVSNYLSSDVWVYNADTLAVEGVIPVGTAPSYPSLIEILPDQGTVFVLLRNDSRVAIIQGLDVVQNISSGGSRPFGIAADAANQRVYISHRDSANMSMVRQEGGVWHSFPGPILSDQRQLFELAYSAETQILYSVYAEANGTWRLGFWEPKVVGEWGQAGTVTLPSGGDVNSPDVGGAGLAVNPSTGNVFNVNTGAASLSVVDGLTPAVIGTVGLGTDPFAIAINSSTDTVFVGLRASGNLVKLDDSY